MTCLGRAVLLFASAVIACMMLPGCNAQTGETDVPPQLFFSDDVRPTETVPTPEQVPPTEEEADIPQNSEGVSDEMKMTVNGVSIPVIWEDNATVAALREQLSVGEIVVQMSMYGGFEQVGSLGSNFPRGDKQMTTGCGDIVLYNGNSVVVFYGSNTWVYTKLGRIALPDAEVRALFAQSQVILVLTLG